MQVSDRLGEWIVQAQGDGDLDRSLPPELVLYTLFARACDPVPGVLKSSGRHSDEQVVDWVLSTCFSGIATRPS
jgi:TetR/AcrR family transcriptional regulator of autoinduction and epiphytic fitness